MDRPLTHRNAAAQQPDPGHAASHQMLFGAIAIVALGLIVSALLALTLSSRNADHLARELDRRTQEDMTVVVQQMKGFEKGIRGTRGAVLVGGQEHINAETYEIYAESRDPKSEFPGVQSFGFIRRDGPHDILQYVSTDPTHTNTIGLDIAAQPAIQAAASLAVKTAQATMTPAQPPRVENSPMGTWCLVLLPVYRPHLVRETDEQRDRAAIGWAFAAIDLDSVIGTLDRHDDVETNITDVTDSPSAPPMLRAGRLESLPVVATRVPVVATLYGRTWQFTARGGARFAANFNMTQPRTIVELGALLSILAGALVLIGGSYLRRSAEMRSQQALFSSMVANASDAIIMESIDGIVLGWNSAAEAMFGYRDEEAIGKALLDLIVPEDRAAENSALVANCARGLHVAPFDTVRRRRDGSAVDVSIAAAPVTGIGKRVVGIAKTVRDISARKATDHELRLGLEALEREVQRRTEALTESERDLRAITDALPSKIAYWDRNLVNRFANRAYREWYGVGKPLMVGMPLEECLGGALVARIGPYIAAALRGEAVSYEREEVDDDGKPTAILHVQYIPDVVERSVRGFYVLMNDISDRKAMESQLVQAARCDKLTGLANRAQFMERLERSVARVNERRQSFYAVLFLDFDRFKLVNDTLGHEAGDELLRQIASRLRKTLRATDAVAPDDRGNVVSRFGGDEFLLLINDLVAANDAVGIAERLLNALAPPYDLHGNEVHSSASIGIITSDQCRTSAEDVVRNADVAMYEAKRAGRACSVVFDEAMHTRLARHVTIENGLRRAIGTSELYLVYQPIVDLNTRCVVSAEALIRWNHPTLGIISPSEFVPIAEETGLIVALGQWVQNQACTAMAQWLKADPRGTPATISVNVSRAELGLGSKLLTQISETLKRHGLPAQILQLEITEREIMRHPEAAHALMVGLQALGVKLAMDDFGTGTSSLGCLRHYPFDTIKVDRSFIQDISGNPDVLAVIHATINLVENLGMASLAEGVEEAGQVAILQSLGCRYAQGYFFSRPVPAERFLDVATHATRKPYLITTESGTEAVTAPEVPVIVSP